VKASPYYSVEGKTQPAHILSLSHHRPLLAA